MSIAPNSLHSLVLALLLTGCCVFSPCCVLREFLRTLSNINFLFVVSVEFIPPSKCVLFLGFLGFFVSASSCFIFAYFWHIISWIVFDEVMPSLTSLNILDLNKVFVWQSYKINVIWSKYMFQFDFDGWLIILFFGLIFPLLYRGTVDKWNGKMLKVYEVMIWCMYTLWQEFPHQGFE